MRYYLLVTGLALLFARLGHSQTEPTTSAVTARVVALPDVVISNTSTRLVVASGWESRNSWHLTAPGGAFAVRFLAPQPHYHELRQVRLHLRRAGQLREGQLQIRVASVTATGAPANDNLLPAHVLLTTADLQRTKKHLTLEWPTAHVLVPAGGFFLVVECLGQSADEYTSRLLPQTAAVASRYEISRRTQPNAPTRLAEAHGFPVLQAAHPDGNAAESWYRDAVSQEWRRHRVGQSVVLVEAVFE